jgi:transcription elongation GreA/GreB family factor
MGTVDKKELLNQMLCQMKSEVETLEASAKAAASAATHEESKPENKYDTRGLEASYLAGAQNARIEQVKGSMLVLQRMELRSFRGGDAVAPSALIEMEHDGVTSWYFLVVAGAGLYLDGDGKKVVTVTTSSPMGQSLVGKYEGDAVSIRIGDTQRDYEIVSVI